LRAETLAAGAPSIEKSGNPGTVFCVFGGFEQEKSVAAAATA